MQYPLEEDVTSMNWRFVRFLSAKNLPMGFVNSSYLIDVLAERTLIFLVNMNSDVMMNTTFKLCRDEEYVNNY